MKYQNFLEKNQFSKNESLFKFLPPFDLEKVGSVQTLSSGAKKDMLIANFAFGIFTVSFEDVAVNESSVVSRDNKSYNINKRLDRRIKELTKKLQDTQDAIFKKYGSSDPGISKYLKSKLTKNFEKSILSFGDGINLEMVAHQILYINFCERDKPLIDEFKWLSEPKQYDALFDLLEQTNAANSIEPFSVAYKAIKLITE